MEITKIKEKPRFTNVANEDDVLKVIDGLNAQIEALETENSTLRERVTTLESDEIEKILDAAVEAGKIEEGEKDNYRSLLNSNNRKATEMIITSLKPKRQVKNDITGGKPSTTIGEGAWDRKMDEIRAKNKM